MNKLLKNVFLSVGIFAFTLALVGSISTNKAEAAVRTAVVSGDFSEIATWAGLSVPTAADTITINSGVTVTATAGLTVGDASTGSITNNGTLTITGGNLAVTANAFILNNGTITVSGSLTGAGAFTNAAGGTLGIGDSATITSLIATGTGNIVTYSGATPTCKATGYYRLYFSGGGAVTCATTSILENLVLTGGATTWAPSGASLAVGGTLFVNTGATFTLPNIAVTVTGTTTVDGTINTATGTGTHIFVGLVTVGSTGTWNLSGQNSPAALRGGLTVVSGGTFTAGSGVYTFNTNAQALTGTIVIPSVTVTGVVLTNNGTLTTNTALAGSGTMTNAGTLNTAGDVSITTLTNSGTFNISGAGAVSTVLANLTNTGTIALNGTMTIAGITNNAAGIVNLTASGTITAFNNATATSTFNIAASPVPTITTLTATVTGNTVNYTGAGAQTVKDPGVAIDYGNLGLSGSGAKTIAADTDISGTLTITDSGTDTTATLSGALNSANKLYFGTSYQKKGTWGSDTTSTATNQSDTYFTPASAGTIAITLGRSTHQNNEEVSQQVDVSTSDIVSPVSATPPVVTPPAAEVVEGCNAGDLFSRINGHACPATVTPPTSTPPTTTYDFGTTLVKKGTKGEVCRAWQNFFNDKAGASLSTDGNCGKLTIAAAKIWQASVGLVADGILGAKSRAKALE